MCEIIIHTVRLGLSRSHGNPHLSCIFEKITSPLKAFKELRYSPRGNNLDLRIYGKEGQFEADLIIPLSLLSQVSKWIQGEGLNAIEEVIVMEGARL